MLIKNKNNLHTYCGEYSTIRIVKSLYENNYIDIYNCYMQKTFNCKNPLAHISINEYEKIENLYNYLNDLHKKYENKQTFSRCYEVGYGDSNNICKSYKKELKNITVSLQKRCNLSCIMCDNSINFEDDVFHKLYFKTLYKIKNNNLNEIRFTEEGEPFFYKKEMFDYLDSLTINDCKSVKIVTNLTLLNDDDIYHLNELKNKSCIKYNFMFSIDAITEETYKKIRKNNLFDKVIHNAKIMISLGFNCIIHFVIMLENLHELSFYKEFWLNNGITDSNNIKACVLFDYCYHDKNAINYIINSNEWKEYINKNNCDKNSLSC